MQILATIFPAAAGIGLFLALVQFLIWLRIRVTIAFLFGAAMSAGAGVMALCEARYLGAVPLERFLFIFEIQNAAIAVTLISMVWFVHSRLRTGRKWLAWAITASWVVAVGVSLLSSGELVFASVTAINEMQTMWGEVYSAPVATIDPLKYIADLTSLAIMIFVIDASIAAYRQGDRRSAFLVGGPIIFFIVVAGVHTPLVDAGVIQTPYIISLVFVAISMSLAVGLVDDVAKTSELTKRLQIERKRWQDLLENIDLAIVQVDPDGKIAYVNPCLQKLAGRLAEDIVGRPPSVLLPGSVSQEVTSALTDTTSWTSRAHVRLTLETATGVPRELLWFSVAVKDQEGQPDGVISIGQDITDRLKAEAERDAVRNEIEKLTRVLTLGEIASTIAHELSQPIAAVLSNAQTLELLRQHGNEDPEETDAILTDILNDTRRARDLMKHVRTLMFNEAPEKSEFDLVAALRDVISMLQSDAERREVAINLECSGPSIQAFGSRVEIQQVFMNLILNAIQAATSSHDGQVHITCEDCDDGTIRIIVEDSGGGLDETMQDKIFDFFVTSKDKGTGVGLAVSKRVVERHGGTISASNGTFGGARFELTLPIGMHDYQVRHA